MINTKHMVIIIALMMLFPEINTFSQQRTLGLLTKDAQSDRGYTLIVPTSNTEIYLIDACGYKVHQWSSAYKPTFAAYLLENGDLLRMVRRDPSNFEGGAGAGVERRSWEGELLWEWTIKDTSVELHHDVRIMPNGNLLLVAAVDMSREEAISAGRDTAFLGRGIVIDKMLEIKPVGTDSGEIVWEWYAKDHVVQDRDPSLSTYGKIEEHPGKLNLNFYDRRAGSGWCHVNSIDYDPVLDRILISSRSFSEVWVLDHSTTTEEARGTTGGNSGKGGEILYRWGNPLAYNRGVAADQQFFSQHNAHWFDDGVSNNRSIMVFNNGSNRTGKLYSTVDAIETPIDAGGNYEQHATEPHGPNTVAWQYNAAADTTFFSGVMGGAQRLSNGRTVICEAVSGRVIEVDATSRILWEYVNPIAAMGPLVQGAEPKDVRIFRGPRYSADYPGFTGRTLVPTVPLEKSPTPYECSIDGPMTSIEEQQNVTTNLTGNPNPFSNTLTLFTSADAVSYRIVNATGTVVQVGTVSGEGNVIDTSVLSAGVYFLINDRGEMQKLIKLNQ